MKAGMIAAPTALLLATAAVAETTAEQPEGARMYGNVWSEAVGGAFTTMDKDKMTMRTDAAVATGRAALTQPDRDMVMRDRTAFQAEVATGTAANAAASGTMTDDATTGTAGSAGTGGDAAPKMALSVEGMTALCTKVMAM